MSQSLATLSPDRSLRRWCARLWDDWETRSTLIGLAGVLLIHLLLWLLAPHVFRVDLTAISQAAKAPSIFDIEMASDEFEKAAPKPAPDQFVETNPDAPENTPDRTTNFAAQNQQVAQEVPIEDGQNDRPVTEGEKDRVSNQIVSGQLLQPLERLAAVAAVEPSVSEPVTVAPRAEQNPLPGFEKPDAESEQTYGSNIARVPENTRPIPERIEGDKNAASLAGAIAHRPAIDPNRPRPRPQIVSQQQVRPAILAENKFGTTNIGNIAVDARWSNYGSYLQRMIDTVQVQWERILVESKTYPPAGSTVTVRFVLNDTGRIARIVDVDSHSTEQATRACISGITDRAPYGPWSEDMKAVLGEEQEMTFTFYYQ